MKGVKMLDIKINGVGKELTVALKGELNVSTSPELESALENRLDDAERLVFDLSELTYISSAGLRVLLYADQKVSARGTMIIRNLTEDVKDVFEITGFADAMNVE